MAGLISNNTYVLYTPGADETVLWENPNASGQMTIGDSFTLSESMRNFEKVEFYVIDRFAISSRVETVHINNNVNNFSFSAEFLHTDGGIIKRIGRIERNTEYTVLTLTRFNEIVIPEGNPSAVKNSNITTGTSVRLITKVVGINRKSQQ